MCTPAQMSLWSQGSIPINPTTNSTHIPLNDYRSWLGNLADWDAIMWEENTRKEVRLGVCRFNLGHVVFEVPVLRSPRG